MRRGTNCPSPAYRSWGLGQHAGRKQDPVRFELRGCGRTVEFLRELGRQIRVFFGKKRSKKAKNSLKEGKKHTLCLPKS
jgi:hypothetical protein